MKKTFTRILCLFLSVLLLSGCTFQLPIELEKLLGIFPGDNMPMEAAPAATVATEPEPTVPPTTQDPNPVPVTNPFRDYYDLETGYVAPTSNSVFFFRSELTQTDKTWLRLARNEIYARRGYVFSDPDLKEYFESMPWYTPGENKGITKKFNKYETHNVSLLSTIEDVLNRKKVSLSGTYLKYYDANVEYILPDSHDTAITRSDLKGMNAAQLKLARNEIFARHGYYFETEALLRYFAFCSWYRPNKKKTSTGSLGLSSVENKNVSVIKSCEKDPDFTSKGLDTKLNYKVSSTKFSVKLPNYWKKSATVTKNKSNDSLDFYQKSSKKKYGGSLFDLVVRPDRSDDWCEDFGYIVGTLTSKSGVSYYLYIVYPSDVQHGDGHYETGEYYYMCDEADRIVKSITGINGYTFKRW